MQTLLLGASIHWAIHLFYKSFSSSKSNNCQSVNWTNIYFIKLTAYQLATQYLNRVILRQIFYIHSAFMSKVRKFLLPLLILLWNGDQQCIQYFLCFLAKCYHGDILLLTHAHQQKNAFTKESFQPFSEIWQQLFGIHATFLQCVNHCFIFFLWYLPHSK